MNRYENGPRDFASALTARQLARHADLIEQYREIAHNLNGRAAMIVLPGNGCRHATDMFRPVHRQEPNFRNRPMFVVLVAGPNAALTLNVAESRPQGCSLNYKITRNHDYTLAPMAGCGSGIRLDARHHVLMTAANNLLQEMVNTADQDPGYPILPKLVIMTQRIKLDERKLRQIAEDVDSAMRDLFIKKRREESEIISHGQLFGDAELLYDGEIKQAFINGLAYEDYEDLLGAEFVNPARKVFMAANPAMDLLREAGVHKLPAGSTSDAVIADLVLKMRERLPWPELATDEDLLDALAKPTAPINFSLKIGVLPQSVIVRAMRAAIPPASALRGHVTDDELLEAARDPSKPMVVHAYSKIQIFKSENLKLPNYASGSLTELPVPPTPVVETEQPAKTLELATETPVPAEAPSATESETQTA